MANDRKALFRERFDEDASEYDRSPRYAWVRATYPFIVAEALKYDFQTCLDVGCGTGNLFSRLGVGSRNYDRGFPETLTTSFRCSVGLSSSR